MKAILTLVLALLLPFFSSITQARNYEDIIKSGYLVIAVYRDFPPYSSLENDQPVGIDIDLGNKLAKSLGVEPRWFWVTPDESLEDDLRNAVWKGHVLDAKKKKADIMLRVPYDREFNYGLDGYGLPRNELVHMFGPYHQESWAIARDTQKTRDVRNLAIFQYEKVGVEIDSMPDNYLSGFLGGRLQKNVVHFVSLKDAAEAFKKGELAAVTGMRSRLQWAMSGLPDPDITGEGFEMLSRRQWDIGVAVKQDYRELANEVEYLIDTWVKGGSMAEIFSQHGVSFEKPSLYTEQ
ncbi:substrate-binding periplasmic protein [Halioxenophilus aromaticivorans]|uniref:Transporter substrate-binding domain-containing protein n=1 Tax=Halioxenophilus aromaticivorans TaxID=1306992 RepID=A0AAV3TYB8_9ALTE